MSYDLAVFDPAAAPADRGLFLGWFGVQTRWDEPHSYDDPSICTPALQNWLREMFSAFPPLNGPHSPAELPEDESKLTDYSVGTRLIYAAFAWSQSAAASEMARQLAIRHGLGFYDVSSSNGEIWRPDVVGSPIPAHARHVPRGTKCMADQISDTVGTVEGLLGAAFGTLIGIMWIPLVIAFAHEAHTTHLPFPRLGCILASLGSGIAGLGLTMPYLIRLWDAVSWNRKPFAVQAAKKQWVAPLPLRPVIAFWWLAHFALALRLAFAMYNPTDTKNPIAFKTTTFLLVACVACFGYAANGFLLLSVYALTQSEKVRRGVWRYPAIIDVGLAIITLFSKPIL